MHELSIALSLIDVASEEAARQGDARVVAIHLRLGSLSGVVKDALVSAFELARENSPLEASELIIEEVPIAIWCPRCEAERAAAAMDACQCAVCGEPAERIVRGREMEVFALELAS